MKINSIIIAVILLALFLPGYARVYLEPVFGIEGAPTRLGYLYEQQNWNVPHAASIFCPSDLANLRFVNGGDTTDIILLSDAGAHIIRWFRCSQDGGTRNLEHNGIYGLDMFTDDIFSSPEAIAVSSTQPLYNPDTDHIFVADLLKNRIVKLNFDFNYDNPGADDIILEDTICVDQRFAPIDLEYIDFNTGNRYDNRLIALDHQGHRLFVFSDEGSYINHFDMSDYEDSISSTYSAFTYKVLDSSTVALYLVDISSGGIRLFHLNSDTQLVDINHLFLGNMYEIQVRDVIYTETLGLWAVECLGPAFFWLAEDLSHIIAEIRIPDFHLLSLFTPYKIIPLPDRIVFLESANKYTGIVSFAFNPYRAKENTQDNIETLPLRYALEQNYPNPFNPYTTIKYEIPHDGRVKIDVFNILGQKVTTLVDENKIAGRHTVLWNGLNSAGRAVASGVYFYRLKSKEYICIKKMTMLK